MVPAAATAAVAALLFVSAAPSALAQPFQPGFGLSPLGNLRTTDRDGPYNISLLDVQIAEVQAGAHARANYTDQDIIDFLVNVECLEGEFDTWGTFGRGFTGNLGLGGPQPIGARRANLTEKTLPYLQEVALNEQGHALLTRQMGGKNPCPVTDPTGGFNDLLAVAYKLNGTVKEAFGEAFDPYLNDVNFVLSVLTLEELGATGNKGLAGILINPVHANAVAGLATSATAQATVERFLLWQMRYSIVQPFNETAQQVFARISAYRDMMDGAQFDDQGIVNTDDRFIAVPDTFVNLIPTDIRGLTFSRTPQMLINIVTIGSPNGKGGFFPNGLLGKINSSKGFNLTGNGTATWPPNAVKAKQQPVKSLGTIPKPITAAGPATVPGVDQLTQSLNGNQTTKGAAYRGFIFPPPLGTVNNDGAAVQLGVEKGTAVPPAVPDNGDMQGAANAAAPSTSPSAAPGIADSTSAFAPATAPGAAGAPVAGGRKLLAH